MRGGARFPLFVLLLVFTFVLYEHAVRRLKAAESAPGPVGLTFPVSRADPEALFTVKLMSQREASTRSVSSRNLDALTCFHLQPASGLIKTLDSYISSFSTAVIKTP